MTSYAKFHPYAGPIRIGIFCCLVGVGLSHGARQALAIAYGRVDVEINNLLVSGASGTAVTGIGTSQDLEGINTVSLATSYAVNAATNSGLGIGQAPRAFVGNPAGDQAEDAIFANTDTSLTNMTFARADNLFHVTAGPNTLISGGVNMDAVAESSIDVPAAFLETSNSMSELLWSLPDFPTTDSNGGARDINVSFSWTRRAELLIDTGISPLSTAEIDIQAGVSLLEYRDIGGGIILPFFRGSAPGSAFGTLIVNPPAQEPGDPGIDSTVGGTFSHTFSFVPGAGATGRYALFGSFSLEATVTVAIPEPSTFTLLGMGVIGLAANMRRRRRRELRSDLTLSSSD